MSPTNADLETVFKHSRLPSLGYSFQSAIACDALKICLVRIATNMQKKAATSQQNQYWWQGI